jgi:PTS system nitrogen regulatory IIA component
MRLSEIINEEKITAELKAKDKEAVLEELAEALSRNEPLIDKSNLVKVLLERERLGSTAIGDGVAIPHGKLQGLDRPIVTFGRSKSGLDFESMDGQPTHLFFLLVAPENSAGIHLKALAKIAKILKNSQFRKALMEARDEKQIYETIVETDEET